jgi:hypothetical protein
MTFGESRAWNERRGIEREKMTDDFGECEKLVTAADGKVTARGLLTGGCTVFIMKRG